jgi:UDP-N-acetylglucosamine--N-acetylmuramyl-(pentapeptide) pyrophosphoryl-undecaprenol N-acetylglucosamine transferase
MKITLVAGGTGGHIFPALALENELRKNGQVKKVAFLTTTTPLSKMIIEKNENIIRIPSYGFIGKSFYKKILALIFAAGGVFSSLRLLKKELPDAVCGFGGYSAFPYLAACYMRGIPFILHEQNLIPGRVTRFLSRFSKEVLISFPDSKKLLPPGKIFFTGNLCKGEFVRYHRSLSSSGYEPENKKLILIVGGSQGSYFLNRNLPASLLKILNDFPELSLVHIAGEKEKESVKDMYKSIAWKFLFSGGSQSLDRIRVIGFSPDMLSLLKEARLVISRAGATILSEICLCGVPAILVPFAESSDNHQYHNAVWFKERAAAVVMEERNFREEFFYNTAKGLLASSSGLKTMSGALLKLARPDAAKLAAERMFFLCH